MSLRRPDQVACASQATTYIKPANSRAIAVQTAVVLLPRPLNIRYRVVSGVCAFQAISRTLGGACSSRYSFALPTLGGCLQVYALSTIWLCGWPLMMASRVSAR